MSKMLAHAREAHPRECCGILLGEGATITAIQPARNIHPAPGTQFEIDPQALVDAHRAARRGGRRVLGYYHSHPNGLPRPSVTDEAMLTGERAVWAIVAAGDVTFWQADGARFTALPYAVLPR